jgi:biopolymer transport protein ExbB/TolQ
MPVWHPRLCAPALFLASTVVGVMETFAAVGQAGRELPAIARGVAGC